MTFTNAVRQAALNAICTLFNGGSFVLLDASNEVLAQPTFGATAFGSATSASPSVATSNAIGADNSPTSGDIASFQLRDSGGTALISGTVGVSDADFIVTSVTIPGDVNSIGIPGGLQLTLQLS